MGFYLQPTAGGGPLRRLQVIPTNKLDPFERLQRASHTLRRGLPDLRPLAGAFAGDRALILGAAPSLATQLPALQRAAADPRARLFVCDRMLEWALVHGFAPTACVILDGDPNVVTSVRGVLARHGGRAQAVRYLCAIQVHPAVFDCLEAQGLETLLFHNPQDDVDLLPLTRANGMPSVTLIRGGSTVVLTALVAAVGLGCRTVDVFGFDCDLEGGEDYVAGAAPNGGGYGPERWRATIGGRTFLTTPMLLSFAEQLCQIRARLHDEGAIDACTVHGDGLVHALSVEDLHGDQ